MNNERQTPQTEAQIQELVHETFQRARQAALEKVGHVVEAHDGRLLKIDASGMQTEIGTIASPTKVEIGERKTRVV